ncbi:MAG: hypothetical protein JSU01_04200 [Bacteroidetes bacterium]|nr:hypothetical protein [Bacteroidota bacterium]
MKARLNLTIEEGVLHDTKLYAEKKGISVSEMVENYLKMVTKPTKRRTIIDMVEELGPSNIDPKADLKELYYQDPKHGG